MRGPALAPDKIIVMEASRSRGILDDLKRLGLPCHWVTGAFSVSKCGASAMLTAAA